MIRFAVIAVGVFAVLMIPWKPLEAAYAAYYRTVLGAPLAVDWFGYDAELVRREELPLDDKAHGPDTYLRVEGIRRVFPVDSRRFGFLPTATFLALLSASSVSLRRKLTGLALGGLLIHLFILLRLAVAETWLVTIHAQLCGVDHDHAGFLTTPWWEVVSRRTFILTTQDMAIYFVAAVLAWIVGTFRRSDVDRLIAGWREGRSEEGQPNADSSGAP